MSTVAAFPAAAVYSLGNLFIHSYTAGRKPISKGQSIQTNVEFVCFLLNKILSVSPLLVTRNNFLSVHILIV